MIGWGCCSLAQCHRPLAFALGVVLLVGLVGCRSFAQAFRVRGLSPLVLVLLRLGLRVLLLLLSLLLLLL